MSFQLESGSLKCIYIDRKAAARGEPAWVVECDGTRYPTRKFTILADKSDGVMYSHGPPDPPLHVDGPVLWLETTATIDFS